MVPKPAQSKHARIRQTLIDQIASGRYDAGQRLPSESELVKTFGVSRPTVNRALRELQLTGLIDRRAGSGSYVRADAAAQGYVFGLLIPELGRTEIFEPICRGMADAQHGSRHVLLWGTSLTEGANLEEQASQACRQLVARKVSGVFFAPLELTPGKDVINRRIASVFDRGRNSRRAPRSRSRAVSRAQPLRPRRHRQPASRLRARGASPQARLSSRGLRGTFRLSADGRRTHQRVQGGVE